MNGEIDNLIALNKKIFKQNKIMFEALTKITKDCNLQFRFIAKKALNEVNKI